MSLTDTKRTVSEASWSGAARACPIDGCASAGKKRLSTRVSPATGHVAGSSALTSGRACT